nr:MAG TPA: hypothetical protein [Bacteriophage sp.]
MIGCSTIVSMRRNYLKMTLIVQLVSDCQVPFHSFSWLRLFSLLAWISCYKSCTHSEPNYASTTWIIIQFRYP